MKSILLVTMVFSLLIGTSSGAGAQKKTKADSIHFFEGTGKDALVKAKAEHKYLFFDAYASWCGPCKTMEREVYTNSKVASYFNEKFIAIKVDMELGEGPMLLKKLPSVDGYPSLLFFDSNGNLTKTILGSRNATDLLQEAKLVAR